jgi:uncharacterized protein YkwD
MRRGYVLVWGVALLALTMVWPLGAAQAQSCAMSRDATADVARMLVEVNAQRSRAGLARLSHDATLDQAALMVACDNARRNRLSHTTDNGSTLGSRLRGLGYRFGAANENLTARGGGPGAAVQAWMSSPPHRTNILAREMREFGGASVRSASGQTYWVMVSAARR